MEDPRTTMKPRASARRPPVVQMPTPRTANQPTTANTPAQADIAEDNGYYIPATIGRSAIRYRTTAGDEIIQQGNRRLHIHYEKPPSKQSMHWLLFVGVGMVVALLLWVGLSAGVNWWSNHQIDAQYGNPRTWQTDEVVGHNDSPAHPTHFIFLNLNAHVIVIEFPGGDVSHSRIYSGPQLFGDNAASLPVTGEFKDVNGDGKVDMVVHVGDQHLVYLNNGTEFKQQQQTGGAIAPSRGGSYVPVG